MFEEYHFEVYGPKGYSLGDLCEEMDRKGEPRPLCKDGLHTNLCSVERHTCRECGSKEVFQVDDVFGDEKENFLCCDKCHSRDCGCSCMTPDQESLRHLPF